MADCAATRWGQPRLDEEDSRWLSLAQAAAMEGHIRAVCKTPSCRASARLNPAHWLAMGLGGHWLEAFSKRMRCPCGGRQVGFQLWAGEPEGQRPPGPYIFL